MTNSIRDIIIKASALIRAYIGKGNDVYVHINDCPALGDAVGMDIHNKYAYCFKNGRKCENLQIVYKNSHEIQCKMKNPSTIVSI